MEKPGTNHQCPDQRRRELLAGGLGLTLLPMYAGATPMPVATAEAAAGAMVNIRDFGARGDGDTIDSPAIDRAINHAAELGGGTVYFPPGVYASYTVHLRSGITLHLDRGATLLAASVPREGSSSGGYDAAEPQDPAIEAFQDFGHNHWRNSLIHGEGLHDIGICGDGLIWGRGLSRGHGDSDHPIAERPGVGNKAIGLKNCRNVRLTGFSILEGGHFALLATGVDNLLIDGLLVDTNRDGFDIDCCRNVRVSNCTINSPYDDAIVPKSSYALGYPRITENVTITNCQVSGGYAVGSLLDGTFRPLQRNRGTWLLGRIKCGTESNGGFRNITISNCVFDQCWGLAIESVDGAVVEDLTINNLTLRGGHSPAIYLRLGRRMRGPTGVPVGTMRRIAISNVSCNSLSPLPCIIAGIEGHPIEDVQISNLLLEGPGGGDAAMAAIDPPSDETGYPDPDRFGPLPASGFFIRHARNIDLSRVDLSNRAAERRPGFWLQDVRGFDASFLRVPTGQLAFDLRNVSDFRMIACRGRPDRQIDHAAALRF